jgi:hypothetical protein
VRLVAYMAAAVLVLALGQWGALVAQALKVQSLSLIRSERQAVCL